MRTLICSETYWLTYACTCEYTRLKEFSEAMDAFPREKVRVNSNLLSQLEAQIYFLRHTNLGLTVTAVEQVIHFFRDLEDQGDLHGWDLDSKQAFRCSHLLETVLRQFQRELSDRRAVWIEPDKLKWIEPSAMPFGEQVYQKFPSLREEILEAGACFALSRYTAAAFHSVRSIEFGMHSVAKCLGVPEPQSGNEKNWYSMLDAIKTAFSERWPGSKHRMSGDGYIFDTIHGMLSGIRSPYRNRVAHFDQSYNERDAIYYLNMAEGLLSLIADRMDENGLPHAQGTAN